MNCVYAIDREGLLEVIWVQLWGKSRMYTKAPRQKWAGHRQKVTGGGAGLEACWDRALR